MKKTKKELLLTLALASNLSHRRKDDILLTYPILYQLLSSAPSTIRGMIGEFEALGWIQLYEQSKGLSFSLSAKGKELVASEFSAFFSTRTEARSYTLIIYTGDKLTDKSYNAVATHLSYFGAHKLRSGIWMIPTATYIVHKRSLLKFPTIILFEDAKLSSRFSRNALEDGAEYSALRQYARMISSLEGELTQMMHTGMRRPTFALQKYRSLTHALLTFNDHYSRMNLEYLAQGSIELVRFPHIAKQCAELFTHVY